MWNPNPYYSGPEFENCYQKKKKNNQPICTLQSIMADVNEKVVVVENKNAQDPVLQLDYSIKHPLHNTWTLWFDNPGRKNSAQNWAQNLKEVFSFTTVEDFWR